MSDYLSDVYGFCIARSALENLYLLNIKHIEYVSNIPLPFKDSLENLKNRHFSEMSMTCIKPQHSHLEILHVIFNKELY